MPLTADPGQLIVSTHYGDVLRGGVGNDTLVAGVGTEEMAGGGGADLFQIAARPYNGVEIDDFQLGVDRLDLSALYRGSGPGPDPVSAGYVRFESNGAGGTKVMLDPGGPADPNGRFQLVAVLDHVAPAGLTAAQVFGGPPGVSLVSSHYGDVLIGGAGDDTLIAGRGPDRLTGGPGADVFVYPEKPYNGGEITDFHPGVDRLDLSGIFHDPGADPVLDGYVRFDSDGAGGTKVMVDVDGPSGLAHGFQLVTILDGVSPLGLTAPAVFGSALASSQVTPEALRQPATVAPPSEAASPVAAVSPAPVPPAHIAPAEPADNGAGAVSRIPQMATWGLGSQAHHPEHLLTVLGHSPFHEWAFA